MMMNKTIAIIGSSRRNGNTRQLIDLIAKELAIEVIDISAKTISPYDYEHKNSEDDFLPIINQLLKYDNIIFASPVYWYAMSAQMKTFIDRFSDLLSVEALKDQGRALRGKVGYVVSTSINAEAGDSFLDSFTNTFTYLGMNIGATLHLDCKNDFSYEMCEEDVRSFILHVKQLKVN